MIIRSLRDGLRTMSGDVLAMGEKRDVPRHEGLHLIRSGQAEADPGLHRNERVNWPKVDRRLRAGAALVR